MALTDKLSAIGDAIREKTGGTSKLTLDQMATEIGTIQGGEIIADSSAFEDKYFGTDYNNMTYYNDRIIETRNYAFAGSQLYSTFNLPNLEKMNEGCMYRLTCNGDTFTIIAPKLKLLNGTSIFNQVYKNIIFDAPNVKYFPIECFLGTGKQNTDFEFYHEGVIEAGNSCFNQCKFSKITLPNLTTAGTACFQNCTSIYLNLPNLTTAKSSCFYYCTCPKITLPNLTTAEDSCFQYYGGTELNLPNLLQINNSLCSYSSTIKKIDFGENCKTIITPNYAFYSPFYNCNALEVLIFRSTTLIPNPSSHVLNNSGISKRTGYIYVPSALVEEYKVAANWSVYADQIRAIEDYPEICGEVAE